MSWLEISALVLVVALIILFAWPVLVAIGYLITLGVVVYALGIKGTSMFLVLIIVFVLVGGGWHEEAAHALGRCYARLRNRLSSREQR